ncbi:LSU ribosomal protein L15p (L27Ae), mitochondrial [Xanthomonas hortorum pv. vitians]|nr:LSU ribosomal protein L15p (L27Ae), mitochondrial [Xanthomonas hortorum pv. vitians]
MKRLHAGAHAATGGMHRRERLPCVNLSNLRPNARARRQPPQTPHRRARSRERTRPAA